MNEQSSASSGLSALLSFTAENVRSYRDEVHLSLLATRMAEKGAARRLAVVGNSEPVSVLPAAGIFGSNASGKTAILEAVDDMRFIVSTSFRRTDRASSIFRRPFLLDEESRQQPSRFEVELILQGVRWQYGFEIDDHRVHGEYAYHYPKGRQAMVFDRGPGGVEFGPPFRSSGRVLEKLIRGDSLLLSIAGATEYEGLGVLHAWFESSLSLAKLSNRGWRTAKTAELVKSKTTRNRVLSLLRYADLGVTDVHQEPPDPASLEEMRRLIDIFDGGDAHFEVNDVVLNATVRLTHSGPTGESRIAPEDESQGTQVWLGLIGPVMDALTGGTILLADELDTSLHPHLVNRLIRLFQHEHTNPRLAQLIFNSHDTNILGDSESRVVGRDQVWFTKKDLDGVTSLYPLTDYAPRRDDALERRYLQGRYGAVPSLNPAELERALGLVDA